jgi:glucose-1-phosphate adenylyltransferase
MKISKLLSETLTLVLAGGQGELLYPLTKFRAKPAVPFGGEYRIIDFTLSNCVNSGLKRIYVLTQYMSHSLDRHLKLGWNIFSSALGEFLFSIPPQFRSGYQCYLGTADAVFQNLHILQAEHPERVLILSGDHIYKMDYSAMIEAHVQSGAIATIAAVEVEKALACRMGVLQIDDHNRVLDFEEKPAEPKTIPDRPDQALVNMGVYIFDTKHLVQLLRDDAQHETAHDFGRDILPGLVPGGGVVAFPFLDENQKQVKYWRDIGTLDSYYEASMDLVQVDPLLNLYDTSFPIRSFVEPRPPAKLVFGGRSENRMGIAVDSLLCHGCIISGGRVERSIIATDVRIHSYSHIEDSILFARVEIGRNARVRRAIIDEDVKIPAGFCVGFNAAEDAKRFTTTDSGIVVVPKWEQIE